MAITATATQLTLNDEMLVSSMIVDEQTLDFTAYSTLLSEINPTLTIAIDDGSRIYPYLAHLWSSGETTQSISVTPSSVGSFSRSVTVNDGVSVSSPVAAAVDVVGTVSTEIPIITAPTSTHSTTIKLAQAQMFNLTHFGL